MASARALLNLEKVDGIWDDICLTSQSYLIFEPFSKTPNSYIDILTDYVQLLDILLKST